MRFTAKVNELCDELDERVRNGVGVAAKDAPRLMISGCPMAIPNWKLHSIAQATGATWLLRKAVLAHGTSPT